MSDVAVRRGRSVARFAPHQTQMKLAELEGDIVKWRKLKVWPKLESAVDDKIAEQAAFVANWDEAVGINHGGDRSKNAARHTWSVADAEAEWGISQPTVSRWRKLLKDTKRYRARLMLATFRASSDATRIHREWVERLCRERDCWGQTSADEGEIGFGPYEPETPTDPVEP